MSLMRAGGATSGSAVPRAAAGGRGGMLDVLLMAALASVAAGVAAALVAWWAVEPRLEDAIALEESHAEVPADHVHEDAPVSRSVQRTAGLAAGTLAVALGGGLLAAVAGMAAARLGFAGSPLRGAAVAALAGGYAAGLLPALAYPANPPGVGSPETSAARTWMFLAVVGIGLAAAVLAAGAWRRVERRGRLPAVIGAGAVLAGGVGAAVLVAEPVELPAGFPADVLWEFRRGSLLVQGALWLTLAAGLAAAEAALGREPAA